MIRMALVLARAPFGAPAADLRVSSTNRPAATSFPSPSATTRRKKFYTWVTSAAKNWTRARRTDPATSRKVSLAGKASQSRPPFAVRP